jgi:hypothetical protein
MSDRAQSPTEQGTELDTVGEGESTKAVGSNDASTGKGNPKKYLRNHLPYFGQNPRTIRWPSS